ncbi:FG-GAP-like repeat-containing protein [Streptomyces sp. NPDC047886]
MSRTSMFARAVTGTALVGALLGGLMGTARPAAAAEPSVPSWLVPVHHADDAGGAGRSCTAIALSATRVLTAPDCFTGRSQGDITWGYDLSTGYMQGGGGGPIYRTHPQYNATTRHAAIGVENELGNLRARGKPVLAGSADTVLYRTGSAATFYSWAAVGDAESQRVRHREQVVVRSGAACAAEFGMSSLPYGMICSGPAPGTALPDPRRQCVGDSGGALVSNGKLIAFSATPANGCVRNGLRLYTAVPSYRGLLEGWARDVDFDYTSPGSVLGLEPDYPLYDFLTNRAYTRDPVNQTGQFILHDVNLAFQGGDFDGNGYADVLARSIGGTLYRYPVTALEDFATKVSLGTGWNRYNKLFAVRDWSGDGRPDIIGRDSSGYVWMHPGTASGGVGTRVKIGTGWGGFTAITGRGDLSGDGKPDLLARDRAGDLWLYRGNGRGGFLTRTKMGAGWGGFNAVVASGDFDNDGRQDVIARKSTGATYLYNVNNRGGLVAAKLIATNWKRYVALT